jgi:Glycosyl transferase family 2/Type I phosphodiesterase / nucleotide pyrophosphatase
MPAMSRTAQQPARAAEVWAARAWNVFNEGRPFSVVYPLMVLLAAAPVGLAPDGSLGLALLAAFAASAVLSRFAFPLRGRALLWLAALAAVPLLEPWRAPALLAGAVAGYAFFTVVVWGSVYYHLRTGAPWTNGLRFWRLVATNSDPTSGNSLEQVPKLLIALSAATLVAEEPTGGSIAQVGAALAIAAGLGFVAARAFAKRLPRYPERTTRTEWEPAALARRVYVVVVDGCNRGRLWQADAPVMDRLAREGTEYLAVEPAYPARTVVCFSSMLTGATPAEHGMRSNFAPRLGVRCESVFDVLERDRRRGRLVGIAHLLDPFGEDEVRSVTSVQPTSEIDRSLTAEARRVVEEEDPDLLVLQLLAADQLGHVRGVRSPEYLEQLAETDGHVGDFLAFLEARGKLDGATVILMADHGQGRGIGGHGHLDWGERPVPLVVWGEGAQAGAISREPRSVLEVAATVSRLLGVEAPKAARGRALVPVEDPRVEAASPVEAAFPADVAPSPANDGGEGGGVLADVAPSPANGSVEGGDVFAEVSCFGPRRGTLGRTLPVERPAAGAGAGVAEASPRCLAVVVARDEEAAVGDVLAALPAEACGLPVDVLLVDDGSRDRTASIAWEHGARVHSHPTSRGVGAALRTGLGIARDEGYAAAVYLDGDGEYDPADFEQVLEPVARGRADYVLGSRFLGNRDGMSWHRTLANRTTSALLGFLMETVTSDGQTGYRAFSARALASARIAHDYNYAQVLTLSLWGHGIEPVEVPIRYRRRTSGRSFVRYPEYLARVAPAVWREWRAARASRRTSRATATPTPAASQNGQPPSDVNSGSTSVSVPNGASGRSAASEPSPQRTSA